MSEDWQTQTQRQTYDLQQSVKRLGAEVKELKQDVQALSQSLEGLHEYVSRMSNGGED